MQPETLPRMLLPNSLPRSLQMPGPPQDKLPPTRYPKAAPLSQTAMPAQYPKSAQQHRNRQQQRGGNPMQKQCQRRRILRCMLGCLTPPLVIQSLLGDSMSVSHVHKYLHLTCILTNPQLVEELGHVAIFPAACQVCRNFAFTSRTSIGGCIS